MRITFKLFAALAPYLPEGARDNAVQVELDGDATIDQFLDRQRVPRKMCHLVLVNGIYVAPDARGSRKLVDGDTLAAWPPVAGG